ncbi:MAG: ribose-5-phosphate isomerase RpiA [Betaproteobacteria bacterium]|jgi:ribose 5-phosphate isomerase A|nr:ribose-5-phosphate isomerase RpiA [Betaproteobacteria bacterium]
MTISDQQRLKIEVAKAAVAEVPAGAILGVGTGSTVDCFIDELAHAKIKLQAAVSSSRRTTERLTALGYKVIGLEALAGPIDLYIDGADEIDPNLCMIKGGGGALTQEKIVASAAHRFICIVDASKRVEVLGRFPLPLEVIAAAIPSVTWAVRALGGEPSLRPGVITDNGHPILDVRGLTIQDPKAMETALNQIPGIVTNGIFALRPADLALVASNRGVIRLQHK